MSRRLVASTLFSAILGFNFFMYVTDSRSVGFDMVMFAITLLGLLAALTKPVPRRLWLFLAPLGALLAIYSAWIPLSNDLRAMIHFAGGMVGLAVFTFAFQYADEIVSSRWCRIFAVTVAGVIAIITINQISFIPDYSHNPVRATEFKVVSEKINFDRVFRSHNKNFFNAIFSYHFALAAVMLSIDRRASTQTLIWMGNFAVIAIFAHHLDHRSMYILAILAMIGFAFISFSKNLMSAVKIILPCIFTVGVVMLTLIFMGSGPISLTNFNLIFIEYTDRWATSGREIIWPAIFQALDGRSVFGLGGHITFDNIFSKSWSSHSLFMQVFMQTGYIGLILTAGWLLGIWALIVGGPHNCLQSGGVTLFLMIAGHSTVSVFLLQNNIIVAIPCWLVLGLICGLLHKKTHSASFAVLKTDKGFIS